MRRSPEPSACHAGARSSGLASRIPRALADLPIQREAQPKRGTPFVVLKQTLAVSQEVLGIEVQNGVPSQEPYQKDMGAPWKPARRAREGHKRDARASSHGCGRAPHGRGVAYPYPAASVKTGPNVSHGIVLGNEHDAGEVQVRGGAADPGADPGEAHGGVGQALGISQGSFAVFDTQPISLVLLLAAAGSLAAPAVRWALRGRTAGESRPDARPLTIPGY